MAGTFQLSEYLKAQNIVIKDFDPQTGSVTVEDNEGEGLLDVRALGKSLNLPQDIDITLNTPDSAINRIAPSITATDRVKLSAGNAKGSAQFLKDKFDEVSYTPDKGVVVREGNAWYQVDPQMLGNGDAWEKAQELGRDIAEVAPSFVGKSAAISAGAAAGTAVGGPVGGVVGAGLGAFAAESAESAIGKLVGTYEATPQEFLADTTLEALMTAGLYAIPVGARPVWGKTKEAFKNISEKASSTTKQAFTELTAKVSNTKPSSVQRLFDRPNEVNSFLDKMVAKQVPSSQVSEELTRSMTSRTIHLFKNAKSSLSRQFAKEEANFLGTLPTNGRVNIAPIAQETLAELHTQGLLKLQSGSSGGLARALPVDRKTFDTLIGGEVTLFNRTKAYNALRALTDKANKILPSKGASWKEVLDFRRELDDLLYNTKVFQNDQVRNVLGNTGQSFRSRLVEKLEGASPESKIAYRRMNDLWKDNVDAVRRADDLVRLGGNISPERAQTFISKFQSPERYVAERDFLERIGGLQGKRGEVLASSVLDMETAREFSKLLPSMGFLQGTALATGGSIAIGAPVAAAAPVVGGILAASSPRAIARITRAVKGRNPAIQGSVHEATATAMTPRVRLFNQMLKNMDTKNRQRFLQDQAMVSQAVLQMLEDSQEDEIRNLQLEDVKRRTKR